jgi:hypothetical protein
LAAALPIGEPQSFLGVDLPDLVGLQPATDLDLRPTASQWLKTCLLNPAIQRPLAWDLLPWVVVLETQADQPSAKARMLSPQGERRLMDRFGKAWPSRTTMSIGTIEA